MKVLLRCVIREKYTDTLKRKAHTRRTNVLIELPCSYTPIAGNVGDRMISPVNLASPRWNRLRASNGNAADN